VLFDRQNIESCSPVVSYMFCVLFWIKFFPHNLTQWFTCCFISVVMLYNVKSDMRIIFHGDFKKFGGKKSLPTSREDFTIFHGLRK